MSFLKLGKEKHRMKISIVTIVLGFVLIGISILVRDSSWLVSMKLMTITFCFGMWLMALFDDNCVFANKNEEVGK